MSSAPTIEFIISRYYSDFFYIMGMVQDFDSRVQLLLKKEFYVAYSL